MSRGRDKSDIPDVSVTHLKMKPLDNTSDITEISSNSKVSVNEDWSEDPENFAADVYISNVCDLRFKKPVKDLNRQNAKVWLEFKATSNYKPIPCEGSESDDSLKTKEPAGSIVEVRLIQKKKNMLDITAPEQRTKNRFSIRKEMNITVDKIFKPLGANFQCGMCHKKLVLGDRRKHLLKCMKNIRRKRKVLAKELIQSLLDNPFV